MDSKRTDLDNSIREINEKIDNQWQAPHLFRLSDPNELNAFQELVMNGEVIAVHDDLGSAIAELYDIEHPEEKDSPEKSQFDEFKQRFDQDYGTWAYFPWSKRVVHFPEESDLRRLRTSRNRNLVTAEEQEKLYDATVAVFGLSVGSNVVDSLLLQGIGGKLVFADMDHLEPSNLNRIRAAYHEVGLDKIDYVAKRISETDPYIEQVHYRDGLTDANLSEILENHRPSVFVDEMDQLEMKIKLRRLAKENAIPVISAADDGNDTLVDIERYDSSPDTELFNGIIPMQIIEDIENGKLHDRRMLGMIIGRYFIGPEHIPLRMFQSLDEVGKTLPSWPQLGGAAVLAGVVSAYCVKQIVLGLSLKDGRHVIGPEHTLSDYSDDEEYQRSLEGYKARFTQL